MKGQHKSGIAVFARFQLFGPAYRRMKQNIVPRIASFTWRPDPVTLYISILVLFLRIEKDIKVGL